MAQKINKPDTSNVAEVLRRAAHPTKQYLGDPAVIDGLLRLYGKEILDRLVEVAAGRLENRVAGIQDTAGAVRLSKILTGKDPGYQPQGAWNTGDGLAQAFRNKFGITEKDPTDAVEVGMVNYALALRHAFRLHQETPAADWQGAIDDTLETWGRLILGAPD